MRQGIAVELPDIFLHSATPSHKRGKKDVEKTLVLLPHIVSKGETQTQAFYVTLSENPGILFTYWISQLEKLSFCLMPLSAAISALVSSTDRCQTWNQPCQRDRKQSFSEHAVSFYNKTSYTVHRIILYPSLLSKTIKYYFCSFSVQFNFVAPGD